MDTVCETCFQKGVLNELTDIVQVEDGMYEYVKNINVDSIPWCLEYFNDSKNTSLCFKRNADPVIKEKIHIGCI